MFHFPENTEYHSFYENYIIPYKDYTINQIFDLRNKSLEDLLLEIPNNKWDYKYAPDKWSIKELFQHIIDADRIFSFRALHIARQDNNPLYPFDEDKYVNHSEAKYREPKNLKKEIEFCFQSSRYLFDSFNLNMLKQQENINNHPLSVRALAYISVGHPLHHFKVIKEKYL